MATYLLQNGIAHFYNRENVTVYFPESELIHFNGHSLTLLKLPGIKKVIDVPFALNTTFIRYPEPGQGEHFINEFDLLKS